MEVQTPRPTRSETGRGSTSERFNLEGKLKRFHVRITATLDRYIEADSAPEAEQQALDRCRQAIEPIGFPVTFHPVYSPHATSECREIDPNLETIRVRLEH